MVGEEVVMVAICMVIAWLGGFYAGYVYAAVAYQKAFAEYLKVRDQVRVSDLYPPKDPP